MVKGRYILLPLALLAHAWAVDVDAAAGTKNLHDQASCLALAERDPRDAYQQAQKWHAAGGGIMARYCAAIALVGLDRLAEAASRLQRLAAEVDNPEIAINWLAQTGQIWFMAGHLTAAETVQTEILQRYPNDAEYRIDRASTRLAAGHFTAAIADLDYVLKRRPQSVDALVYRGVAHRYADALDLASQDIEQAKALAPTRADIWLERGILQQLRGNLDRAREDFIEALSLTDDLQLQEAIRDRIELMDLS